MHAIYIGSFDPPHLGHYHVVNESINKIKEIKSNHNNIIVHIIPNNPRPGKPNRSQLTHRINMLNIIFKDLILKGEVIIEPDDVNLLLKELSFKYHHLIGIMGSDSYLQCLEKRKCKTTHISEWIIIKRLDELTSRSNIEYHDNLLGTPIICYLDVAFQDQSSSYIKEKLYLGSIPKYLPIDVVKYIHTNKLYHIFHEEAIKIRQKISQLIESKIDYNDENFMVFPKVKGKSKHTITLIVDGKYVAKIFLSKSVTHPNGNPANKEKNNYSLINKCINDIQKVNTPKILFTHLDDNFSFIIMDLVVGKSLTEILMDNNILTPDKKLLCYRIGRLLKSIHDNKYYNIQFLSKDYGPYCLLHGDVSPNNFIISNNLEDITIIDAGETKLGFPCREYYQFISSLLYCLNSNNKLIEQYCSSFKSGYNETNKKVFTYDSEMLFYKLWLSKNYQNKKLFDRLCHDNLI